MWELEKWEDSFIFSQHMNKYKEVIISCKLALKSKNKKTELKNICSYLIHEFKYTNDITFVRRASFIQANDREVSWQKKSLCIT